MIRGDSTEYELLAKWCETSPWRNKEFATSLEIGVREGMGSKVIIETFKPHMHFGVDPYGNLEYQHYDHTGAYRCDYTDDMYKQMMLDFMDYKNFHMYKMTDIDFMNRHHYLGPFHFVHFDGPHMTKDVIREAVYFADRSEIGTRFVFDDYPKYNMSHIMDMLGYWNFRVLEKGDNKICLEKQKLK